MELYLVLPLFHFTVLITFLFLTSWNFFCPLKFLFSSQNHFHFTKWLPLKFLLSNMDLTFHCMKVFVMKRLQHPNILLYMGSWHHLNVYALWQSFSRGLFCSFLLTPLSQEHYDSSLSFYVSQSTCYLAGLIIALFICILWLQWKLVPLVTQKHI